MEEQRTPTVQANSEHAHANEPFAERAAQSFSAAQTETAAHGVAAQTEIAAQSFSAAQTETTAHDVAAQTETTAQTNSGAPVEIAIDRIYPNPNQPRKDFDEAA